MKIGKYDKSDVVRIDGVKLRALRKGHTPRFSQRDLARAAGVSSGYIGALELGTRDVVSRAVAKSLARALGVSREALTLAPEGRSGDANAEQVSLGADSGEDALLDQLQDLLGRERDMVARERDIVTELQRRRLIPPTSDEPSEELVTAISESWRNSQKPPSLPYHQRTSALLTTAPSVTPVHLSPDQQIVGGKALVVAAQQLQLWALQSPSERQVKEILLTATSGGVVLIPGHEQKLDIWMRLVRQALDHGWSMSQLIMVGSDAEQTISFIDGVRPLLHATDRYAIHYLAEEQYRGPLFDVLVIPGVGGLLIYPDPLEDGEPVSFFVPPNNHLVALERYARHCITTAPRLFSLHHQDDTNDLHAVLEQRPSNHILAKYGPSVRHIPVNIYKERLKESPHLSESQLKQMTRVLEIRGDRRQSLLHCLSEGRQFLELCPRKALEELAIDGRLLDDDELGVLLTEGRFSDEHILAILHTLIELLKYPSYRLGLLDSPRPPYSEPFSEIPRTFVAVHGSWEFTGSDVLLLELWTTNEAGESVAITLQSTCIPLVKGYFGYLMKWWNRLSDDNKNSDEVADFLQKQARIVEDRIAGHG